MAIVKIPDSPTPIATGADGTPPTRACLVTGVSRGLGLVISRKLLAAGWTVLGISRRPSAEWEALAAEFPGKTRYLALDLAEPAAIADAPFREFLSYEVALHGLVNNAAVAYDDLLTNLDLDAAQRMFATNVFSAMALTRAAVRNMLYHKVAGSLVHVSSISTRTGFKGLSFYAASKGALEAFSKNVAREWGPRGIRSNCVVPGFLETDMSSGLADAEREKIFRRNALPGATSLEEVARSVVFLLGTEAGGMTGQALAVDRGAI
ncbi:MAG: SDR family oxidoreductase [Opitutales bacterium]|nr:SDR family oxidoreductase [Opitutales bacterium]